jgi:hypothetical protein
MLLICCISMVVFGFFFVEIMASKPKTSLVNAHMTHVKMNGKNYIY